MGRWKVAGSKNAARTADAPASKLYDEANLGLPAPGPYRALVRRLEAGEIKSGDNIGEPKLHFVCELAERNGKKAKYDGYGAWANIRVTEDNEAYVNQFLTALVGDAKKATAVKVAFWAGQTVLDDGTGMIEKIGTLKIDPDGMEIGINLRRKPKQGEWAASAVPASFFPAGDLPETVYGDDDDEDEVADDDEDVDDETEDGDDEDGAASAYREELEGLTIAQIKTLAKTDYPEVDAGDLKGLDKDGIVDLLMGVAFPDAEAEPDEDEDEDEPEEAAPARRPAARRPQTSKRPPF